MKTNRFLYKLFRIFSPIIKSDKIFISLKWKLRNSSAAPINIDNPRTFNEKLNWLKLHDRNPLYTVMADKLKVKSYIERVTGGGLKTAAILGIWNSADEIEFERLPDRFVLKCTHDSGSMIICKDKSKLDYLSARKQLASGLKRDFYLFSREWPYKNIEKKIIAEEYLENDGADILKDYKFWCFNGIPKLMYITNKIGAIFENFYDMDFNPVAINHGFPRFKPEFEKPSLFDEMKHFAEKLSAGIPFVRIDFWVIKNQLYFGEFTFYDWGGFQPFAGYKQDMELGKWISLLDVAQ